MRSLYGYVSPFVRKMHRGSGLPALETAMWPVMMYDSSLFLAMDLYKLRYSECGTPSASAKPSEVADFTKFILKWENVYRRDISPWTNL